MSLVTVLRSPSTSESTSLGDSEVDEDQEDSSFNRSRASSFEGFFASKGAAYALPDGDFARRATKHGGEMQLHLQAMVNLLRDEDVLRLVVKLECQHPNRIRYLTIVSAFGPNEEEQSIVMGVDWTDKATIGLVVPLYRDTSITLDGDGGFKMMSAGKANIFKPISVQTMWTALQWIHKCADNARRNNYFYPNGSSHEWADYYYSKILSDRLCLNEWHQMEDIESKRPDSPIGTSTEKELVMKLIRHKLREVMMKVDLEDVTSRQVRTMLEEDTQMDLKEYRSFIDEEMFTILGQMDSASKIFDHVYLGSEWNASNLEELKENGVGYILNVTREIDNFFPGTFHYHNIRVYDVDDTELLRYWDNTYKFIQKAKNAGSKVLVHCRMGISRSASTVIAYGMKEYGWSLGDSMKHVKTRRNIVQPNSGFWKQLITYEGILNSSKQRYNKLFTNEADPEAGPVRKTKANIAVKKDAPPQCEGVDTVDNLPRETVSDQKDEETSEVEVKDPAILRVTAEENSEVGLVTAESHEDVFTYEDDLRETKVDDLPINPILELSKETVVEDQSNSCVSETPTTGKTALYRVSSVPVLPSDDKTMHKSNVLKTNFQRSSSLRERGPKRIQYLRDFMEGKAASDENITECDQKEKGTFQSQSNDQERQSGAGSNSLGGLPSDLHGLLESGFVKRKSRNFEEGVYDVLSVELDDILSLGKEMDREFELGENEKSAAAEKEQDKSEEPEPGVVKKHKEEYELKHRESLKRGAVLQRGESGDGSSLKRERSDGILTSDADGILSGDGSETERPCSVNVDALVQKVNEDMKKEVSARRVSKKERELRALVQLAGEDGNSNQENENSVEDSVCNETTEMLAAAGLVKETNEGSAQLLEDPPISMEVVGCAETELTKSDLTSDISPGANEEQALSTDGDSSHSVSAENTCKPVENGEDNVMEQDEEDIPQKGLVKRHTLLIEGKLQPWDQETEKDVQSETEKAEREHTMQQEVLLRSPSKEQTFSSEGIEQGVAGDVSATLVTESKETEDRALEEDTQSLPEKGLVKRHTLLIEGRHQALEQALPEVEIECKQEGESTDRKDHCTKSSEEQSRDVALKSMEPVDGDDVKIAEDIIEQGKTAPENVDTCELLDDKEDMMSVDDVPQRGLVKRQTLVIEGKLQLGPEQDEFAVDQESFPSPWTVELRNDEPTGNQDMCSSICLEQEQSYQPELTSYVPGEVVVEKIEDSETVSGLVRREKERIEKRVKPLAVEETNAKREEDNEEVCKDGTLLEVSEGGEEGRGDAEKNEDVEGDRVEETELSDVGVDTSSVVRVRDQTQHLEGIIRVTTTSKDGEKIKRQRSKEDLPTTGSESAKIIIVPRSCSDESVHEENQLNMSCNMKMEEILSDSAVNLALMNAQEKLELANETFIDWDGANVKQRTRIFETIMQHISKQSKEDEEDNGNHIRRCGSMPKAIGKAEKYVIRRRSFSDVSETVSSSSGREVGYTIKFSNGQSSSSSSLPREWSPLQRRLEKEKLNTNEVFSPQNCGETESEENMCTELIDCQDQENDSPSVKEKFQVLDSKNHRNISNVS